MLQNLTPTDLKIIFNSLQLHIWTGNPSVRFLFYFWYQTQCHVNLFLLPSLSTLSYRSWWPLFLLSRNMPWIVMWSHGSVFSVTLTFLPSATFGVGPWKLCLSAATDSAGPSASHGSSQRCDQMMSYFYFTYCKRLSVTHIWLYMPSSQKTTCKWHSYSYLTFSPFSFPSRFTCVDAS